MQRPSAEKLPSATVAAKTSIDRARSPPPSIFAFISKILRLRWRYSGLDLESIYAFNATERVNHGISSAGIVGTSRSRLELWNRNVRRTGAAVQRVGHQRCGRGAAADRHQSRRRGQPVRYRDRKSTRLNSSH